MHAFRWEASTRQATDLGTLQHLESSWAHDINDSGQIVGISRTPAGSTPTTVPADGLPGDIARSFVWDPRTGTMTNLSPPFEEAVALNDEGMAISDSGVWLALPNTFTKADTPLEAFVDINNAGWILSASELAGSVIDPTTWSTVELTSGTFAAGAPTSMNIHGQVVGGAEGQAVMWQPITS
jgi:uncharacterized membrane protein